MKDESEDHAIACDAAATKSVKKDVLVGLMVSGGNSIIFSNKTSGCFLCGRRGCRRARDSLVRAGQ